MNKKDLKIINQMIKSEERMLIETGNKFIADECEIRIELLEEIKLRLKKVKLHDTDGRI